MTKPSESIDSFQKANHSFWSASNIGQPENGPRGPRSPNRTGPNTNNASMKIATSIGKPNMIPQSASRGHQSTGSEPGCLVIVVAHCRAHTSFASMSLVDRPASINLGRTSPAVNPPLIQVAVSTNGPLNGGFIRVSGILWRPAILGGSVEKM